MKYRYDVKTYGLQYTFSCPLIFLRDGEDGDNVFRDTAAMVFYLLCYIHIPLLEIQELFPLFSQASKLKNCPPAFVSFFS